MPDEPVRLPGPAADELFRAATRVTEEVVMLAEPPQHDGTPCMLVPIGVFDRLERAVLAAKRYAPTRWRP